MKKSKHLKKIIYVCLLTFVSSCGGRLTYTDNVRTLELARGQAKKTRVLAAMEEWRNSGVKVSAGNTYKISGNGQWRTYGTCNWTGPDGTGLHNALCFPVSWFPPIIPGWSHSALIAKIGETGQPFGVGKEFEFAAETDGILYFSINDTPGFTKDNEGYVDVETSLVGASAPENIAVQKSNPATYLDPSQVLTTNPVINTANQQRTALIIGNSDYSYSPLKNPVNDATDMANLLKKMGFDVILKVNANQEQMEQAIDNFGRKLKDEGVSLFYYAGHGIQLDGENYLVPVKAVINRQNDVRYKAVNLGQVLGAVEDATNSLNIVILDACRNNPLPRSFRSSSRGLARVEGPKGTIIGFATSPGSEALDGEGDNGVYTKHLLRNINLPGISIEQVFKKVLQGVNQETGGKQTPWTESSFTGNFSFVEN